jgi:hypothetical protein
MQETLSDSRPSSASTDSSGIESDGSAALHRHSSSQLSEKHNHRSTVNIRSRNKRLRIGLKRQENEITAVFASVGSSRENHTSVASIRVNCCSVDYKGTVFCLPFGASPTMGFIMSEHSLICPTKHQTITGREFHESKHIHSVELSKVVAASWR